ncbi:hypothetical protein BB560_001618 [Smittium megazygosporum]|uniref:Uncharacterized protein n=1 Tax=Smittium megazygosporum TaxID=133381 RepID=A0A2T9ZH48_9FUNG|nr:hypothetical protein BB560_001618 [Smittium megazygosporum]
MYIERCPFCNKNTPETIEHILINSLGGGESKETRSLLAQSRDRYSPYMKELETGRFMNGIRVVQTLILDRINICNKNTPETIEHMLIECFRWNSIRHETTIFNIPRLYRTVTIDQSTNNQALNQGRNIMVGKLLGGESKETRSLLSQSRDRYSPYMKELETGRFMNGIRVVRTLILDRIKFEFVNGGYEFKKNVMPGFKPAQLDGTNSYGGQDNYNNNQGYGGQDNYNNTQGYGGQDNYNNNQGYGGQDNYNNNQGYGGQDNYNNTQGYGGQDNYNNNQGYGDNYNNNQGYGGQDNYNNNQGYGGQDNYNNTQGYGGQDNYNNNQGYGGQDNYNNNQGYGGQNHNEGYNDNNQRGYDDNNYDDEEGGDRGLKEFFTKEDKNQVLAPGQEPERSIDKSNVLLAAAAVAGAAYIGKKVYDKHQKKDAEEEREKYQYQNYQGGNQPLNPYK